MVCGIRESLGVSLLTHFEPFECRWNANCITPKDSTFNRTSLGIRNVECSPSLANCVPELGCLTSTVLRAPTSARATFLAVSALSELPTQTVNIATSEFDNCIYAGGKLWFPGSLRKLADSSDGISCSERLNGIKSIFSSFFWIFSWKNNLKLSYFLFYY